MNKKFFCLLAVFAFLSGCGSSSEELEDENLPYPGFRSQDVGGEKNFATLINKYAEGKIEPTPWAGYWWPYTENGIASGGMSRGRGSAGSPAGKYDAARGGTTGAQAWEAAHHSSRAKGVQQWWGHCNGWCAASALFPEPKEEATVNGIVFSNADIKALLTEAGMSASADFFGNRVDWGNDYTNGKYNDVVPGQYFLILTNYIGKLKQAVLIDRFTGDQVWNQPLAGYRFEYPKPADYLGADPSAPNVYRIILNSTIWWMRDDVPAGIITPPFTFEESDTVQMRALRMELWVDAPIVFDAQGKVISSGNVIITRNGENYVGGDWRIGEGGYYNDGWPDYMWVPYSLVKPTDPDQDFVNPHVDLEWIKKHLLVPGGADDTSASPRPVDPVPSVSPLPSLTPRPTPTNTGRPDPWPTPTPRPTPTHTPTYTPQPEPLPPFTPAPAPTPTTAPFPPVTPGPGPTEPPANPWPFPIRR